MTAGGAACQRDSADSQRLWVTPATSFSVLMRRNAPNNRQSAAQRACLGNGYCATMRHRAYRPA